MIGRHKRGYCLRHSRLACRPGLLTCSRPSLSPNTTTSTPTARLAWTLRNQWVPCLAALYQVCIRYMWAGGHPGLHSGLSYLLLRQVTGDEETRIRSKSRGVSPTNSNAARDLVWMHHVHLGMVSITASHLTGNNSRGSIHGLVLWEHLYET